MINKDTRDGYIVTVGTETLTCLSFDTLQNSFNRVNAKIMCADPINNLMRSFELKGCIRRELGSAQIGGTFETLNVNGDEQLSAANFNVQTDGTSIVIKVSGIENKKLQWCTQFEIDQLTIS